MISGILNHEFNKKEKIMSILPKIVIISLFVIFVPTFGFTQTDTIKFDVSASTLISSGKYSPFWMNGRSYSLVSLSPMGAIGTAKISKDFGEKQRIVDYEFLVNAAMRADNLKKRSFCSRIICRHKNMVVYFLRWF